MKKNIIDKKGIIGTDIWCKNKPQYLPKTLQTLFPEIQFFEWDFITESPKDFNPTNPRHSIYFIQNNDEDAIYSYEISLDYLHQNFWNHMPIYKLAEHLARTENNTCLVLYGNKDQMISYYPELLFEQDEIFVVNSIVFDNKKTNVTKLKQIHSIDE